MLGKLLTRRLIVGLIALGIIGGSYFYLQDNNTPLVKGVNDIVPEEKVKEVQESAEKQLGDLSAKAKNIGEQAKQVLGASVQINEEESSSIQERAIEYGQYLYCRQVVTEYESKEN